MFLHGVSAQGIFLGLNFSWMENPPYMKKEVSPQKKSGCFDTEVSGLVIQIHTSTRIKIPSVGFKTKAQMLFWVAWNSSVFFRSAMERVASSTRVQVRRLGSWGARCGKPNAVAQPWLGSSTLNIIPLHSPPIGDTDQGISFTSVYRGPHFRCWNWAEIAGPLASISLRCNGR